eukprot:864267-Amphidinium_carterae.2
MHPLITNVSKWHVRPCSWTSPLASMCRHDDVKISRHAQGEWESALCWQAIHGYPILSQTCLRNLRVYYGIPVPNMKERHELTVRVALKLTLLHHRFRTRTRTRH